MSLLTERDTYIFKRDINADSDGAHLTSFGIEFQTEEETIECKRSALEDLLCAVLLRIDMACELERELRVCYGLFINMLMTYDGAILLWQW